MKVGNTLSQLIRGAALMSAARFTLAAAPQPQSCCEALVDSLGSKVWYSNSTAYKQSLSSYWSAQEQSIHPACILGVESVDDVSTALKVLVPEDCRFAVRGGGHGTWAGVANTEYGVTIDLRGLDSIELIEGKELVSVGSGQSVGNIYSYLYPYGVAISGGRSYDIGISGSTLGAGWGWLSNQAGFSCDNVVEYEVVLGNGSIVTATQTSHQDLWKALKGGGTNFGIVTKFVFRTIHLGQIWNGEIIYALNGTELPQLFGALVNFTSNPQRDPKASVLVSSSYDSQIGFLQYVQSVYSDPVKDIPPVLEDLFSIPGQKLLRTINSTTLPDLSYNYNKRTPKGLQQISVSLAFKNSLEALQELQRINRVTMAKVSHVREIIWSLSFQPVTSLITDMTAERGGNMLGIDPSPPEGLHLALLTVSFPSLVDYNRVREAVDEMLATCRTTLQAQGTYHRWEEMNHAGRSQHPIASYGSENQAFLRTTAEKYDTDSIFQTLRVGGYRLGN